LQEVLSEAEVSWLIFRAPAVVTGITISANTEGERKQALNVRNSAAQDIYMHQKTCRACLSDRTTSKK
jgi:hypothetical protein